MLTRMRKGFLPFPLRRDSVLSTEWSYKWCKTLLSSFNSEFASGSYSSTLFCSQPERILARHATSSSGGSAGEGEEECCSRAVELNEVKSEVFWSQHTHKSLDAEAVFSGRFTFQQALPASINKHFGAHKSWKLSGGRSEDFLERTSWILSSSPQYSSSHRCCTTCQDVVRIIAPKIQLQAPQGPVPWRFECIHDSASKLGEAKLLIPITFQATVSAKKKEKKWKKWKKWKTKIFLWKKA